MWQNASTEVRILNPGIDLIVSKSTKGKSLSCSVLAFSSATQTNFHTVSHTHAAFSFFASTLTMVKAASFEHGCKVNRHANMEAEASMPTLSTQPPVDMNWQITLKDKVVAITGANRGIGLGVAEVCLANGVQVVYSLDLMEPSEDFAALSKKYAGRLKYKQMDVTIEESVQKAIDDIVVEEGAIHGMICNAGEHHL